MERAVEALQSALHHVNDGLTWLEAQTGLSPLVLFTVLALLVGAYYLISGIVAPSQIGSSPLEAFDEAATSEVKVREMTINQLGDFDGRDPSKPLYMAIKDQVYDVSSAKDFYGPGGPYSVFAGKDASRALAKMSFQAGDLTGDLEGLTDQELEVLKDWEVRFDEKYPKVGFVVLSKPGLKQQSYAQEAAAREAEHKVEEEHPKQVAATQDKVEEEYPKQAEVKTEVEHKSEEEHPTYAQVAAIGGEHNKEEEPPKQDKELASRGEHVREGQAEAEQSNQENVDRELPSTSAEDKPGSVTDGVQKSASDSKSKQSSGITRDVPVSDGEKAENEDGNENGVVTRDIPVSGEHEADEGKQQQEEEEVKSEDTTTKQVDENTLSSDALEQVLEPSKEQQYGMGKRDGKHSQDEKDFELVDKGKVPDAENLVTIRDSDYIRGLRDVSGL